MKIDGLTKLLTGKHLLLKLFLAVFLSLLFVFRLEAQYVLPSEEKELQQIIKNDDPNLERIRRIIDITPRVVFGRDQSGNTPLHDAARTGNADVVALLLDRGWTPLHYAARYGHADVAAVLLDRGVGVESRTDGGWTPLHYAAKYGNADVVVLLLDRGADVNSKNFRGKTPLQLAATQEIKDLLIKTGAEDCRGVSPCFLDAVFKRLTCSRMLKILKQ